MFLFALVIALLVGALFSAGGTRGPWPSALWFFLLLFVGTFVLGSWAQPVGPRAWGVPWVNFLIAAIFLSLLVAALTPDYRHGYRHVKGLPLERDTGVPPERESEVSSVEGREAVEAATAVGVFFWIFLVVALGLMILRLIISPF
jgi:hypothetical protein